MTLIADRFGVAESVDDSRSTALDLIQAHPDLEGFLAFGSQGPIGAGRAIDELRRGGEIHVLGPFSPGQGRRLVHAAKAYGAAQAAAFVMLFCHDWLMDGSPIIAKTPIDGLYLNGGWCYGGFKATPASGWCFAWTIAKDAPHEDNAAFTLDRFERGVQIDEKGAGPYPQAH